MDLQSVCTELNGLCTGYKDTNTELYNYYRPMLEWLYSKHEFGRSEAEKLITLQREIWDKEAIEREKRTEYLEIKYSVTESEKSTPAVNKQIIYTPKKKYKPPFEKVIEFTVFGYNFFFVMEVGKKV